MAFQKIDPKAKQVFFSKKESKSLKQIRNNAREWLHLAGKIYHFRRDVLNPKEREKLETDRANLEDAVKDGGSDENAISDRVDTLEHTLKKSGGQFYPRSTWTENVEMFLVAAILAIGIRTYFVQPFKIPTNSMYPTYNGMTFEVFQNKEEKPG